MTNEKIYCFRANYQNSTNFDETAIPDWLRLDVDWQGYKISTVPEVAGVARILGILEIEDTPSDWISHLESLGFQGVTQTFCEEMFESKGYY